MMGKDSMNDFSGVPLLAGLGPQSVARRRLAGVDLQAVAGLAGLELLEIHFPAVATQSELLALIARTLHFPGWFGGNLDALYDCLADLEGGCLIALHGLPDNDAGGAVLDVFRDAAEHFATRQRRFLVVVDGVSGSD